MSHWFRIQKSSLEANIRHLTDGFSNRLNFYVVDDLPYTNAMTLLNDNGRMTDIYIGISNCRTDGLFNKYISDVDYARIVMNIYHEYEHCRQCNEYFQVVDFSDKYVKQAVEELARINNNEYYSCNHNYLKNSNEIEAEYESYLETVSFLEDSFSNVSQERRACVMLELMNEKCKNDYFIKPVNGDSFQSLSEIDELFAEAYENSLSDKQSAKKLYFVDRQPSNGKLDSFKAYIKNDRIAREAYLDATTKYEQDLVLASVNIMLHPEYNTYFKCLENVDMSYEHVILHQDSIIKHSQRIADLDARFGDVINSQPSETSLEKD